nr:ATP-dependent sacrificial sulfur transferase LarE [Candidatus Njordarchaeum guaymaensis]
MEEALRRKYEVLRGFIQEKGKNGAVIAFSGGVDSSTLAAVCFDVLRERVVAVTAKSQTYPREELKEAKKVAREIGIKHYIVETNELSNEDFAKNPENRCYYCKGELLDVLRDYAAKLGFKVVFEGTNYSDLSGHRPGFKAIKEKKNVFSPWVEAKITKEEIRELARELGLSTYDKPASPCLASRIPYGERITEERLKRIESAERVIRKITGVKELRVRDHGNLARIEVGSTERGLLFNLELMDRIVGELKKLGFKFITMDLEGYRTGSLLAAVKK